MGLPERRCQVYIFASRYHNVRDVLLAQGSDVCLGICRALFGRHRPCFRCFCASGGTLYDEWAKIYAMDFGMNDPDSSSEENMEEAGTDGATLLLDNPQKYTLAIDIGGENRR